MKRAVKTSMRQFKTSVGFLIFLAGPSYLFYNPPEIIEIMEKEASFFRWVMLILAACLPAILAFWLSTLREEQYARLKPLWERPAALIIFIISSPLLLVSALLVKFESAGPSLYSQERVGKNMRKRDRRRVLDKLDKAAPYPPWDRRKGERRQHDLGGKPFILYKLRSMEENAEEKTGVAWSAGDADPRVTRVGYYIRKTHIDELPQLYNVFRGHMSIIGPRPERPEFIAELNTIIIGYQDRLKVRPGITGLAQVRQDYDESLEDVKRKLQHDKEYIENSCLLLDIRIILETIALMLVLFWEAFKRRTTRRKAEPKTLTALIPKDSPMERG
jgi:lipopolysaccharide/colanic/teichoic acid biosynthesis glycosyltransferase